MRDGYAAGAQRDLRWRNREIRQPGGVRQCIDGYGEATGPSADWNENHIGHRESARWRISALEMVEPERTSAFWQFTVVGRPVKPAPFPPVTLSELQLTTFLSKLIVTS